MSVRRMASSAGISLRYSGGASMWESAATIFTSSRLMAISTGSAGSFSRAAPTAPSCGVGVMTDHQVEVIIDVGVAGMVAVQQAGRVHVPAQVVHRPRQPVGPGYPALPGEREDWPPDQHERVVLGREHPVEKVLPPAGERDLLMPLVAADPYLQRGCETCGQGVHRSLEIHLNRTVLVAEVVFVDDGARPRVGNGVERDQGGMDLVE